MHKIDLPSHGPSSPAASLSGSLFAFALVTSGLIAANTWGLGNELPSTADDVTVFLSTLLLAGLAAWWAVNVVAWVWALRSGLTITRFTLPGSKRLAQLLLAASLSTACVAEGPSAPTMVLVEAATAPSSLAAPTTATPTTEAPSTTAPPTTAPPATAPPTTAAPTTTAPPTTSPAPDVAPEPPTDTPPALSDEIATIAEHQVVVHDGDNLWTLAAQALAVSGVEEPPCHLVAEYWRLVVAANQVLSGNANIIVPGEAITMPAFELT